MTYVIGLTGGIGSGKTAVSDHFARLGVTVVDADLVARAVVAKGSPALAKIAEHFGDDVILPDGSLDRAKLRKVVFKSEAERRWLEALTHPLIREGIINDLNTATSTYAVLASPLLVESGQNKLADRILVVDVPEELQLARTIKRDQNTAEQVKAIIAAQASREQRLQYADDVICNDSSLEQLHLQVGQLHQHYLTLAQSTLSD